MDVFLEKPWLQHYPTEIPYEIDYEEKTLHECLTSTATLYGEKKALNFLGKTMSFHELFEESVQFANFLISKGLKKGDRVSIYLPNCPQGIISYYGTLYAGGVVVQTNPLYTERELSYQLQDSGSTFIIGLDLLKERIENIRKETPLKHVIITSIGDYLPFPKNMLYPFVQKKEYGKSFKFTPTETTHSFKESIKNQTVARPTVITKSDELALLQYTGGTTGFPKGVMLTHKNLVSNTMASQKWFYKCNPGEEKIFGVVPFFHVYGMTTVMNLGILCAYEMILQPKFIVEDVLKGIEKHKATLFPGAPTMYIALINHPDILDYDLTSIKACVSGSAPLPLEVQETFERVTHGKLIEGYGLSETSPVACTNFIWDKRKNGSIGVPWPDTMMKVISLENGEPCDYNIIGEIIIKGPQVMMGYWNRKEDTEEALKNGYLYTGDLGYMDEEGFFYIVDRKKDMIIAGGFNIYPREIEEVLYENEKILEVVVAGVPDPYRGETVKAYVVLKEGVTCTEKELDEYSRKYLAAYKIPRIYEFRTELPKTAIGKILRRSLIDEEKRKLENTQLS